jgi:urease accessory protein
MINQNTVRWISAAALLMLMPLSALAHVESGVIGDGGFVSGMFHPVTGVDHVVAMVAVGLWGAILGQPAIWVLPVAFPLVMAVGSILGIIGIPVPAIDIGVALSGIVLGAMVATVSRPPLAVAFFLISIFAVYHGYPHGAALPDFGMPLLYISGFVFSTGLLHLSGVALGLLFRWRRGQLVVRAAGGVITVVGAYYLLNSLGSAQAIW